MYAIEVNNKFEGLNSIDPVNEMDASTMVERKWNTFKDCLCEAAKGILPKQQNSKKKQWVTEEILKLIEQRKTQKGKSTYDTLNRKIKLERKLAKEKWLNEQCKEIEELDKQHNNRELHNRINVLTGRRKRHNIHYIKDRYGKTLIEMNDIKKRWIEYSKELFGASRKESLKTFIKEGPLISKDEIENAINQLKQNKAPGQ